MYLLFLLTIHSNETPAFQYHKYPLTVINKWLLITSILQVENFMTKSEQKIWNLITQLAYTSFFIFQIFCSQSLYSVLHNFSRLFVDYFWRKLLTLHVFHSLLITFTISYKSIFKLVNNLLITNNETLIYQNSSIFEKSCQPY